MGLLKTVLPGPPTTRNRKGSFMAKALIGYLNSDLRDPRLAAENSRLRARVGELEDLVLRLTEENDRLVASRAAALIDLETANLQEMQPA
ncbi:hypothetical protein NSZ01_09360 [Nocardioides szechwanensis]|nr:hypothetical protein NSZ01_09360 [Nocardioides szechwanensis]